MASEVGVYCRPPTESAKANLKKKKNSGAKREVVPEEFGLISLPPSPALLWDVLWARRGFRPTLAVGEGIIL